MSERTLIGCDMDESAEFARNKSVSLNALAKNGNPDDVDASQKDATPRTVRIDFFVKCLIVLVFWCFGVRV